MKPLLALKERLTDNNTLVVQNENGYVSEAGFTLNNPIKAEDIISIERQNNILIPNQYKEFLLLANGALLFKDIEYGQWGCELLPLQALIYETNQAIKNGWNFKKSWLVFAKWLGDGDLLVFDIESYQNGEKNYIIDGDQGCQTDKWECLKGDFNTWMDRLIVAQGAKYWRWY